MNYFIRLIVYVCLYTWLVVGLGYGQCGKQVFNPDTGLLDCTGVTGSGGVGGAAALTTAGGITFPTSAGTLGQDGSNLFWDNTNKRLGIGTASPAVPLDVVGNFRASGASSIFTGGALTISGTANAVHTIYISDYSAAAADWNYIRADNGKFTITGSLNNAIWLVPGGAGRVIISGNAGIGPSNTAPTGTLSVVDRTAVTGASLGYFGTDGTNTSATYSKWIFRLGAVQGSNKITEWQANAGGVIAAVGPGGGFITAATAAETLANSQCTFHLASNTQLTFTCKGSDGTLRTNTLTLI